MSIRTIRMDLRVPFDTYLEVVKRCLPAEDPRTATIRLAAHGIEMPSQPSRGRYVPRPFADLSAALEGKSDTSLDELMPLTAGNGMSRQEAQNAIARGLLRDGWEKYRTSAYCGRKRQWRYRRSLPEQD